MWDVCDWVPTSFRLVVPVTCLCSVRDSCFHHFAYGEEGEEQWKGEVRWWGWWGTGGLVVTCNRASVSRRRCLCSLPVVLLVLHALFVGGTPSHTHLAPHFGELPLGGSLPVSYGGGGGMAWWEPLPSAL